MEPNECQMATRMPMGGENGAKMVPNGNQNGTETDPKRPWDLKVVIFGSFLDAFWGWPGVQFGTKIS